MKFTFSFASILLLVLTTLLSPALAEDRLTVVADAWMPYNGDPGAKREGYAVEILRAIFEPRGWTVDYTVTPWNRAQEEVLSGQADVLIGALKNNTHDFIYPDQSLGKTTMCFYTNRQDWQYSGPDSLKSVRTGFVKGYEYRDWFREMIKLSPKLFHSMHGDDAFPRLIQMLADNRIQALPGNQAVMDYYLKSHDLQDNIFLAGCVKDEVPRDLYFALSPANPIRAQLIANTIDKGIATMRKTGQLNYLLIKYGLKDWVKIKR